VGPENFGAVSGIFFVQRKLVSKGGKNIAATCVPDPPGDIFFLQASTLKNGASVLGGEVRNLRGEEIAEESVAVIESEKIAMFRGEMGGGFEEAHFFLGGWSSSRNEGGGRTVPEKAGADENARIIVEIGGGGADFDANDECVTGLPRGDESGGLLNRGKGGTTAEPDEIEEGEGGAEAEAFR